MIYYYVEALNPHSHLFNIKMVITQPATCQQIAMASWIPGSYLIRDFARHIVNIHAYQENSQQIIPIEINKINSNTWQCEKVVGPLTLEYTVYAFDNSVRGAYLDNERAFFNGACLFLSAKRLENVACKVKISPPNLKGSDKWRLATTLERENAIPWEFGWFKAENYDELLDHPVEMGNFEHKEFKVNDIPHYLVISGKYDGDINRISRDLQKICEAQIALFKKQTPFKQYLFILQVRKEVYGGLEHRSSSVCQIQRDALPLTEDREINNAYISLLSLFSHEYFHAWNVKSIKPSNFLPYNLDEKGYTRQLWAMEGITSYYDTLMLVRAKLITKEKYFDLIAEAITKLLRQPGRKVQTLAESSFDAWIKFYQQNENSINTTVSYYLKGSLVALLLDLALRIHTKNQHTLDEVMQRLMSQYGLPVRGVPEGTIEKIIAEYGGQTLAALANELLYSTSELPFDKYFAHFGLVLKLRQAQNNEDNGGKLISKNDGAIKTGFLGFTINKNQGRVYIAQVMSNSPAEQCGLAYNDEIVAINELKVDSFSFDNQCKRLKAAQSIKLHIFRQDILKEITLITQPKPFDTAEIVLNSYASEAEQINLLGWLGQ